MQIVNGRAKEKKLTIHDLTKLIPTRLIRFMLRVASFQFGESIILYNVAPDDISWRVASMSQLRQRMPDELARYVKQTVGTRRGHYVAMFSVGTDEIEWSVSQVGRVER